MSAFVPQVARTLGQLSNWSLSNLQLQKIAYIAEMIHLGRHGTPLLREQWQAWDYGPVQPDLYHKAKVYGTAPVKDIFHLPPLRPETSEFKAVQDAYKLMADLTPGQMVAATHQTGGAWANHYKAGHKGVVIPKEDIRREYATLINDD